MDEWINGWLDGWLDGWMDGWINGWMDGRMDGWMDGWMDREIYMTTKFEDLLYLVNQEMFKCLGFL
jgi:hypothetical protein